MLFFFLPFAITVKSVLIVKLLCSLHLVIDICSFTRSEYHNHIFFFDLFHEDSGSSVDSYELNYILILKAYVFHQSQLEKNIARFSKYPRNYRIIDSILYPVYRGSARLKDCLKMAATI